MATVTYIPWCYCFVSPTLFEGLDTCENKALMGRVLFSSDNSCYMTIFASDILPVCNLICDVVVNQYIVYLHVY